MRHSRLSISKQRGSARTVVALRNEGGYFVHIKPDASTHRKAKLVIRDTKGKELVALSGRQISSLKRVLAADI